MNTMRFTLEPVPATGKNGSVTYDMALLHKDGCAWALVHIDAFWTKDDPDWRPVYDAMYRDGTPATIEVGLVPEEAP